MPRKKKIQGVALPEEMQNAGIGTSHWNVAAPRHLGALDPKRETDSKLQSRLTTHTEVPEWQRNKEDAILNYQNELFKEAKRLQANRVLEQDIAWKQKFFNIVSAVQTQAEKGVSAVQANIQRQRQSAIRELEGAQKGWVRGLTKKVLEILKGPEEDGEAGGAAEGEQQDSRAAKKKEKLQRAAALAERVRMPRPKANILGTVTKWKDEEQEQEDCDIPCGECECGGEEFLCAHCDFIRCRQCELAMWKVPHLGALVCDRCYVWYRTTDDGSSSSSSDEEEEAQAEGGRQAVKRPVKRHGNWQWTPPAQPSLWEDTMRAFARTGAAKGQTVEFGEEEEAAGAAGPAERKESAGDEPPGYCYACYVESHKQRKVVEYVCAHCDTIYCPYCQLEEKAALAIGALLCERCFVVWEASRRLLETNSHRAATAPFPAPIREIEDRAQVNLKPSQAGRSRKANLKQQGK